MKLKYINYIFIPLTSLLLFNGCGNSSSSKTQQNSSISQEKIAIYIPKEVLSTTESFSKAKLFTPDSNHFSKIIKENGYEDSINDRWIVYDNSPSGANIHIAYDDIKRNNVIEFNGNGLQNGYVLGYWAKPGSWNDKSHKLIQWSMSYTEDYYIYVRVSTEKGYRYLYYTPDDYNYGIAEGYDAPHYIHHGLGTDSTDGSWKTFTRDLEADLKEFDPDNSLISIDGFFVRGSGRIDDVALLNKGESSLIDDSIVAWLANQGYKNSGQAISLSLSQNKTRAVVNASISNGSTNKMFILDISNLKEIKKLAERGWYRYTHPIETKIKDNDYIILAWSTQLLIYNFETGELLSNSKSSNFRGMWYLSIQDDYAIVSDTPSPKKKVLKKIDFSDRANPIVTTLYEGSESERYLLSSDKSKVIIKDANETIIKEISIATSFPSISLQNSLLQHWLQTHSLKGKNIVAKNKDYSRILISAEETNIHYTNTNAEVIVILDTSNLNNIQELARGDYTYRYANPVKYHIVDNDYIMIAGTQNLLLYDYQTGTVLSNSGINSNMGYVKYPFFDKFVNRNKLIYIDGWPTHALKVVDFSDRTNPSISTLYDDGKKNEVEYHWAADGYSVIVVVDKKSHDIIENIFVK